MTLICPITAQPGRRNHQPAQQSQFHQLITFGNNPHLPSQAKEHIILKLPAFTSVLILKGTLQGVSVNLQVKAGYENPYCLLSCNPHVGTSGHTHTQSPREGPRDHEAGGGGVGPAQADPSRLHHLHAMQPACLFHPLGCNNMRNNASDNDWLGVGRPVQYLTQPLQTPAIVNSLPWWLSSILIPQTEFCFFSFLRYWKYRS